MNTATTPTPRKFPLYDLKTFTAMLVEDCNMSDGKRAEAITFQLRGEDIEKLIQVDACLKFMVVHSDEIRAISENKRSKKGQWK